MPSIGSTRRGSGSSRCAANCSTSQPSAPPHRRPYRVPPSSWAPSPRKARKTPTSRAATHRAPLAHQRRRTACRSSRVFLSFSAPSQRKAREIPTSCAATHRATLVHQRRRTAQTCPLQHEPYHFVAPLAPAPSPWPLRGPAGCAGTRRANQTHRLCWTTRASPSPASSAQVPRRLTKRLVRHPGPLHRAHQGRLVACGGVSAARSRPTPSKAASAANRRSTNRAGRGRKPACGSHLPCPRCRASRISRATDR
mmetsp:Transcript_127072/g.365475  ORF Transcript_127072/g.365475 Transcript_127072/m.365475 type:complete len:253 (-) Transcript_127072:477-1235(-)